MMTDAMRNICKLNLAFTLIALAAPAMAQEDVTEDETDARDVVMTPLSDLNLAKDPIPPILLVARADPYSSQQLESCASIQMHIGDLDAVLGDDFDSAPPDEREMSAGGVAQSLVGMLIPFRGLIREISGANEHEYEFRKAIAAGLMRRAYLKGLGEAKGCDYPARPMPAEMFERLNDDETGKESGEDNSAAG